MYEKNLFTINMQNRNHPNNTTVNIDCYLGLDGKYFNKHVKVEVPKEEISILQGVNEFVSIMENSKNKTFHDCINTFTKSVGEQFDVVI